MQAQLVALQKAYAALKRERDELAERLERIRAYAPDIEAKAKAWVAEIDKPSRRPNSKKTGVTRP